MPPHARCLYLRGHASAACRGGRIEIDPRAPATYNSWPARSSRRPPASVRWVPQPCLRGKMMALICWSASYNSILWQIRQNPKMTSRLPILAIGCCWMAAAGPAWAQNPSAPEVSAATRNEAADNAGITPDVLVRHVIANLEAQSSIAARLRHRIDLLGKPLVGTGIYLQQGRGVERLLRL